MPKKSLKKKQNKDTRDSTIKRLDALIRLFIELNKDNLNETQSAKILYSLGLTPTEVALILGKKSSSAVNPLIYSKKKGAKKNARKTRSQN